MEDLKTRVEELTENIGDYADTLYKLTIVNVVEKTTNVASIVVSSVSILILGMFVILFSSVGLAWWLGNVLDNRAAGFFLVSGFFLLVLAVILLFRKKLIYPYIRNSIVKKVYD